MKQTAVDWLIEKLHSHSGHIDILDVASLNKYWEQAKEMEKNQIIKSHIDAFDNIVVDFKKQEFAEQYYQETYEEK